MLRPGWGRSTEGRFVWGVIGLALVASTLPYLYGWWRTPAGWVFQWIPPHNSADSNTYLAWVQQGARGRLLFEDLYTTETGRMPVFLPLFLAMGLVSRATGLAPITVYHLSRLVEGVHLPICLLAAHGVALLESRFRGRQRRIPLAWTLPGTLGTIVWGCVVYRTSEAPYRVPQSLIEAAQWLKANAPFGTAVLASEITGNLLPREAVRVYLGHYHQTLHYARKCKEVERFFSVAGQEAWHAEQ